MTPALARGPGVLTHSLGAEPADPGRPLPHPLPAPGAQPMGLRLRLLGFTISRLVPPYLVPVLGCQRYHTILPCSAPEGALEAMGMCRGFGVAFLPGNSIKSLHQYSALPLSTLGPGLAPGPVSPDWALLNRVPAPSSARRGARPGRISRAGGGRAEPGAW